MQYTEVVLLVLIMYRWMALQHGNDLMESIEPFDFKEAVDFQTAYLAGYFADKYDVTASECEERANERIRRSTEAAFRDTVRGYASVVPENTSIRLHNGTTKYALYPVWICRRSGRVIITYLP